MRLVEARIEGFGQYRDRTITFGTGLNVIHGTNESGKTTLMKFIEGVLYGFYKPSQRRQYTEDYEKYRPWDGGSYAGTLIYENAGRKIGIYRDFAQEEIRMYDVETGEDLTSQLAYNGVIRQVDPASRDWKISPAAFRNTISIVQGKACPDLEQMGGELQESLLNLATSGDEDISVRNSLQMLRKQMDAIGGDHQEKNSRLGELAAREAELKDKLKQSRDVLQRQDRIRHELAELPEMVEDPQEAALLVEKAGRAEQKEHLDKIEQEVQKLHSQERSLRQNPAGDANQYAELIGLQKSVQIARERQAEATLLEQERQKALEQLPEVMPLEEPAKDGLIVPLGAAGLVLAVAAIILGIVITPICLVGILAGAGLLAYALIRHQQLMQKNLSAEKAWREGADILKNQRSQAQLLLQETQNQRSRYEKELEEQSYRMQQILQRSGVTSVEEYAKRVQERSRIESITSRITQLEEERKYWTGMYAAAILKDRRQLLRRRLEELRQGEDPAALREELAQVVQQKDRLMMERDSLKAAAAAIESLSQEVKKEYAPVLTENMKKTVENITAGRYNTIYVSDQEGIRAKSADGRQIRIDQVSAGTGDQIYFAVRLGMIDLLSPKVKLPLILDDAFSRYDDERLSKILKLLRQEAKHRQILIFSCQIREKELLTSMRAAFQYSELKG